MLRPYTRSVKSWGIPRMSAARFASLFLLVSVLIPLWHRSVSEGASDSFPLFLGGAFLALTYLWWRGCWLLDQHRVAGLTRTLLFPGLLGLGLALLGTLIAVLLLGLPASLHFGFDMAVYHLWTTAILIVPLYWAVGRGLRFTFTRTVAAPIPDETGGAADQGK